MTAASSCLSLCLPQNAPPSLAPSPPPLCPTAPSLYPAPCSIPGTAKYWSRRIGRTTAPGGNGFLSKDLPLVPVNLSPASTCLAILSHLSPKKPGLQMQLHEEEKSFLNEGGHVMLQHDCGKSSQPSYKGSSILLDCYRAGANKDLRRGVIV
jgi:hypothetical protein